MHACFHCAELFDSRKLVCPHCGADRDLTYAEEPTGLQRWGESDDKAYQEFIEREGLDGRSRRPVPARSFWWMLVAIAAISGLILLLL